MAKLLMLINRVQEVWSLNLRLVKFDTGCKQLITTSTSTQVAELS